MQDSEDTARSRTEKKKIIRDTTAKNMDIFMPLLKFFELLQLQKSETSFQLRTDRERFWRSNGVRVKTRLRESPVAPVAPQDQDTILSHHCITPWFQIDTGYRRIPQHDSGVFLRVKHAWYRLLRLLAARVFHTIVAFQNKSGPGTITTGWIPNKLDSGFQWLDFGFHELDSGFQSHGFQIPQAKIAWILDSGLPYIGRIS